VFVAVVDDPQARSADVPTGNREVVAEGHRIAVWDEDQVLLVEVRVLDVDDQVLGVERVALQGQLVVELPLVAQRLVVVAVRQSLGLPRRVGDDVAPELEGVEELE
jgi:hypothetical protein